MDDLISRQWLMECVNEGWIKFDTEKDENRFIHLVRDMAPSAQPNFDTITKIDKAHDDGYKQGYLQGKADYEWKKGKWIRKTFEDWWCNQCGIEVCTETPEDYNFCPNCGAKMRGDAE